MSLNKMIFAAAALAVAASGQAAVASAEVQSAALAPAHVAVDPTKPVAGPVSAPVQTSAPIVAAVPSVNKEQLLLGQINEAAREKVLKSLRSQSAADSSAPLNQIPAPVVSQIPAFPATMLPTLAPAGASPIRVRPVVPAADVSIVGTMADGPDTHVLYSYHGGIYSAAVGQKMLNGVTAKRVNGMSVTVTDGKRSWDVQVSAANATASGL